MNTIAMKIFLVVLLTLIVISVANAAEIRTDTTLAGVFQEAGVAGTFVLYDVSADRITIHNEQRADQRFIPASTFKILNSLIALQTGVVTSENEVFIWDGKPRLFKTWEKNLTLRDAMRESAVPVYQEIARRIGSVRMQEYINRVNFGNRQIGTAIDRFWLDGPLTISALEEAHFVALLAQRKLPFSEPVQVSVREMLLQDKNIAYSLYAKTGWAADVKPMIGWYTGWVEHAGRIYAFSLNIDLASNADLGKRKNIALKALKQLGVLGGVGQAHHWK